MTEQEILAILDRWRDAIVECDKQTDIHILLEAFGGTAEGPVPAAIFGLVGAYTREVADRLNCCPDILEDWWLQHLFGELPAGISLPGEPVRKLHSNADMARYIAYSNARAETGG